MPTFNIYIKKNSNTVLFKGKLEDYTKYSDIHQKAFKQSQKGTFKVN